MEVLGQAGDHKPGGGVQHGDLPFGTLDRSREHALQNVGIFGSVPADQRVHTRRSKPQVTRIDLLVRQLPIAQLAQAIQAERGQLVHAASVIRAAMDDPGGLSSQIGENLAEDVGEHRVEHPNELMVGPRWVQQGTEQIEERPLSFRREDFPRLDHGLEGRVIHRREEEAQTDGLDPARHFFRWEIDLHPQCLQHIRATALRGHAPIAVFGDAHPARRQDEHGRCGDVEEVQFVTARAHHIEHRSRQLRSVQTGIDRQVQKLPHKGRDLTRSLAPLGQGPKKVCLFDRGGGRVYEEARCRRHLFVVQWRAAGCQFHE